MKPKKQKKGRMVLLGDGEPGFGFGYDLTLYKLGAQKFKNLNRRAEIL